MSLRDIADLLVVYITAVIPNKYGGSTLPQISLFIDKETLTTQTTIVFSRLTGLKLTILKKDEPVARSAMSHKDIADLFSNSIPELELTH